MPTTRIVTPTNAGSNYWYDLYIDVLINSSTVTDFNCSLFLNPNEFNKNQILFPYEKNPSISQVNHKVFTFENKVKEITVDSALSETSENPVQNKVVAAAVNELSQRISLLEQKE